MQPFLAEVVALFVAGAAIAYVSYRFGLVPIIGFLLTGVMIGPKALGLVQNQAVVDAAAEIGVILLLFTIGIEFSLEKLASMKRLIFGGGGLQVGLSTLATLGVLALLGVPWQAGLFTGFLVAMSSTTIIMKVLGDRGELGSEPARISLGVSLFQDVSSIAMVLILPVLAGTGGGGAGLDIVWALGKAALIIAMVLVIAKRIMPILLERVALTCSPELFLLVVIAICFGTAYLTSLAGVSVSLGAFLAGLIVSESRFSQHAFSEILPLQILFSATFFISVGMLLDLGFLADNLPLVLGVVLAVLLLKMLTTGVGVRLLGYTVPVTGASAFLLAQVGEFSFVLERAGREAGLSPAGLGEAGSQTFIAATVILMIVIPLLTPAFLGWMSTVEARHDARRGRQPGSLPAEPVATPETAAGPGVGLADHAIVAGYGQAARKLVAALLKAEVPFVITTLSPGGANEAEEQGLSVIRGDVSKQHILSMAGIQRARVVVIADDDPGMAQRITSVVRSSNPNVRIAVRTRFASDVDDLSSVGADRVASEELESVAALAADVLEQYRAPIEQVEVLTEEIRTGKASELAGAPVHLAGTAQDTAENSAGNDFTVSENGERPMTNFIDTEQAIILYPRTGRIPCSHLDQIRPVFPSAHGCEECLQSGDTWVHLRVCMSCGHVGCCDSSKNKHASRHHHDTGHPVIRSLEPGETWGWCYEDKTLL